MASVKEKRSEIDKQSRKISGLMSELSIPIDTFINDLLDFLNEDKSGQEPYAMLVRNAFGVQKNGYDANPSKWSALLPRIEEILSIVNNKGSIFAKMIFNESMGHRYSDCWFETNDPAYEAKMSKCYLEGYKQSCKIKSYKNIDSTMFWLAVAYHRMGRFEEARKYYKTVANRGGPRFFKSSFVNKIWLSFIYSQDMVCLPPYKEISKILDRKNPLIHQLYIAFKAAYANGMIE
jgi:hypothetical protein